MYGDAMNAPDIKTIYRYLTDAKTDWKPKALALFTLLYIVSPVDAIPDIPIFGWIDDATIAGLAWWYLSRKAARYKRKHPEDEK